MKNKYLYIFLYSIIGLYTFYIFLNINYIYYFPSNSKNILTITNNPILRKTVIWPCDKQTEMFNYEHIKLNTKYITISGNYNASSIVYILFIITIFSFWKILFFIFENHFINCGRYSSFKYMFMILFTLFWFSGFITYLNDGEVILTAGEAVPMEFDKPIFIKKYEYQCNHEWITARNEMMFHHTENMRHGFDPNFNITQTLFDVIVIFNIYYFIRWHYIIKNLLSYRVQTEN